MNVHKLVGGLTTLVVAAALSIPAAALSAASAAPGDGSGSGGGGGSSGGADTVGSDYSDLNIVLRAADGTPIIVKYVVPAEDPTDPGTPEYCVQPISYDPVPGLTAVTNPLDGKDVYVLPLQGEWLTSPPDPLPVAEIEACDPQPQYAMFVSEVELERLNMARTADRVMEDKTAAVETKLLGGHTIDLDPAGRIRIDGVPIDAAPEQASIYQSIMNTGTIPGLPADMASPAWVGPNPADTGGNSRFDAWELAAAAVGTAASKGVPINVDSIEYYNQVIGFPPDTTDATYESPWGVDFLRSNDPDNPGSTMTTGRRYVDYSDFSYNRSETFRGSVTWLDVLDLEWHVSKIIDDVPFTHPENDDVTLHGVNAFAQLADDTRAAILYLHDHEVVLPGFYMDPVGIDTNAKQLKAITDPAVDLGALPSDAFQSEPFGITASVFNPHAPSGTLVPQSRVRLTIDAGGSALTADQVSLTTPDDQVVPLTEQGGKLVGWWGPEEGTDLQPGDHDSTNFKVTVADGAPVGPYNITLDLISVTDPGTVLATDTGQLKVNANQPTVLWGSDVPSLATQDSYVTLPLRVYAPEAGTEQLRLTVIGPDDPATPETETIAAGDVKVYGSDGSTMVGMPLTVEGDHLVGTWDFPTVDGYTDVTWYVSFVSGATEGGYSLQVSLVGYNDLDPVIFAVTAPEQHGEGTEGGTDKTPPTVHVETDGTLGTDATFLLSTEVAEDGTTYSCRLTKDDVAGAWTDCTSGTDSNGKPVGQVSYTGLTDGDYVFSARAIDKAGNVSDVVTRSWRVGQGGPGGPDTTPPTLEVTTVGTLGSSVKFELSSNEEGVTYSCRLTKDGVPGDWGSCTSPVTYSGLVPGAYQFAATATDAADNVSGQVTVSWTVTSSGGGGGGGGDITPPALKVKAVGTPGQSATFELSSNEVGATYSCRLTRDGVDGPWEPCNSGTVTYTDLEPATYVFSATATDASGNVSGVVTLSWVVDQHVYDTEAPVMVLAVNGDLGTSASFTLTTDPPEDGVTYQCRLTRNDVASVWEDCTSGSVGTKSYTDLGPGTYTFWGRGIDLAGNVSDPVTKTWVVQGQPGAAPDTYVQGGPRDNGWVFATTARFRLGSDAADAQYRVRVNHRAAVTCDSDCDVSLVPGRNRIRFAARSGGLTDGSPAVRTVYVPRGAASLTRIGQWTFHEDAPGHMFGQYVETTERGATLRHRYRNVHRIAIVASTGAHFGRVNVYLGGRLLNDKPINLGGRHAQIMGLIPVKTFATPQSGIVKVKVVSRDRVVRIDGLGIR